MKPERFFSGRNYADFKFLLSRSIAVYPVVPVEHRLPRDFHFGNTFLASLWCQMYLRIRELYLFKDIILQLFKDIILHPHI